MSAPDLLAAALQYHRAGWPAIPVDTTKRPRCKWGGWRFEAQTAAEVRELFSRPARGLALLTWPASDLVVLDLDGPHAGAAWETTGIPLPPTGRTRTKNGGEHWVYRLPGETRRPQQEAAGRKPRRKIRLLEAAGCDCKRRCGVDLLVNGFFVVPPTPGYHAAPDAPLEPGTITTVPAAVLELARAATAASGDDHPRVERVWERIPQGQRNVTLTSFAGAMRRRGMSEAAISAALLEENARRCDPPLAIEEVQRIAGSVARYAPVQGTPFRSEEEPGPVLVRLADVQPEPVSWLWPTRIPRGKLTLLIGDPGLGKSLLTLDLAARITAGMSWPDGTPAPQGEVVLLTAEDGLADTVRPRLDALGGDPARVHVLTAVRDGVGDRGLTLGRDVQHLETAVAATQAALVVIDPVSAYLGRTDAYRDAEVRALLAPLAALAERTGAAVVGVMHLTKNAERQALYRAQGSLAFVAAARAVFAVAEDREKPERRLFVPVKLNIARKPPALAFRLAEVGEVARVDWEAEPVEVDVEAVLAGPEPPAERSQRLKALEFLREALAAGPVGAEELKQQARQSGISERTLWRAKGTLGVRARKDSFGGRSAWELPNRAASPPRVAELAAFEGGEHVSGLKCAALSKAATLPPPGEDGSLRDESVEALEEVQP